MKVNTAEDFSKLTIPLLQAFVHARQFTTSSKPKGFSWPAKGKVGEAAENLINLAHGLRHITILVLKEIAFMVDRLLKTEFSH